MAASSDDRWQLINDLDEEYLQGGVILSEWCTFITCAAEEAFAAGNFLPSILTAVSAIETYLRSEASQGTARTVTQLINQSGLSADHIEDLHALRRYRNRWVHVDEPWDDQALIIDKPEEQARELEEMSLVALRLMLKTIYSIQCV